MPDSVQHNPVSRLVVLIVSVAMVGSNALALSPILGDVAAALAVEPVTVSRAVTAYGGATALSALLLARRIDGFGTRRALRLSLFGLALATFASALAPHWLVLVLGQMLAGIGAGVVLPATYAMATLIAPPGAQSRTLGWVLGGWSISLVAGVPAAALLADLGGWRVPFLALTGLAVLAAVGTALLPPDGERRSGAATPSSVLAPLRYPGVAPLLLVCLAFMAAFYGVYAFIGDHLRQSLDLSASGAGLIVLSYGIGFGAAGLGDGLLDRIGPRRVLPLTLAAVAGVYAAMIPAPAGFATMLGLAGLWGFANHGALNSLILLLAAARPEQRAAVLGLNSAVTYLGVLVGVGGAATVYARAGFSTLAGVAAALAAAAALLAWAALSHNSARGSFPARGC